MKIALLGYGKMGKTIESIAQERNHQIVFCAKQTPDLASLKGIDVAIEFSTPNSAVDNLKRCLEAGIPVVCGTTGWLSNWDSIYRFYESSKGSLLYASNFSIGVNLFFALNESLARLMAPFRDYVVRVEEIHHTQKKDAPSGTAITLAEGIIQNSEKTNWRLNEQEQALEVPIYAHRKDDVPGTHSISYACSDDTIEIKHTAHSRKGFALGAVIAAEWLLGKQGVFSMVDVLKDQTNLKR